MLQSFIGLWSVSGNTEAMANAVAEVKLKQAGEISADKAPGYDLLTLGCPAMGAEVLEESEFEPFFTEMEGELNGKKVALFGSYGCVISA